MKFGKFDFIDYLRKHKKRKKNGKSFLELKSDYLSKHGRVDFKYFELFYPKDKKIIRYHKTCSRLARVKHLPFYLNFFRWYLYDLFKDYDNSFWGIYCFVGLPGQGKTLSMVAHILRAKKKDSSVLVATNFGYKYQDFAITDWRDIIYLAEHCSMIRRKLIVAIDEIHITFDATDYKRFPAQLQALLSQNRHLGLQFLCSSQRYDRIPSKIRGLCNYVIVSKNLFSVDRCFINYYVQCMQYEDGFSGKSKDCDFIRQFIADNALRNSYDTKFMVSSMENADKEYYEKYEKFFENV